ncbi:hypothetical protein HYFRA_00000697 [Hymenoscyphus fraxineus]|uniref:Uncharacterized protein n=1 Tax=Hymenoscyphus fraxineus TaxID=746836 RepID=A0A9N9KTY9_9HELO|nr:hypothetical protein HYFRA_00000697 [Hymenoscyphus fraxineus]
MNLLPACSQMSPSLTYRMKRATGLPSRSIGCQPRPTSLNQQTARSKSRTTGARVPGELTRREQRIFEKLSSGKLAETTSARSPKEKEKSFQWSEDARKRIYIVGANPRARLFAGVLRCKSDPPPVTVLVSSNAQVKRFAVEELYILQQMKVLL